MTEKTNAENADKTPPCFVIMPISDSEGYEKGHFRRVYEDLFKPACEKAGYGPFRADEVTQTNLIHLDILQRLIDSPMAICDLSSRNPNVLFELGLRQAFDRPTVLVQEVGTPKIFDIAPLRYVEYRPTLKYRETLEDQNSIANSLTSTRHAADQGDGVNSLVRLLSLTGPAALKTDAKNDQVTMFHMMRAEMQELKAEMRKVSIREVDRDAELSSRPSFDLTLAEIKSLLDFSEKYIADGEFKKAYDAVNYAQRKIDRARSQGKLSYNRILDLKRCATKAEQIESFMSTLPNSLPNNPINRSGGSAAS
jgi:hypothetical protein